MTDANLAAAERIIAASSRSMAQMLNRIADLEAALVDARNHIDTIRKAFGAPGDWGYGDPKGDALFGAYQFAVEIGSKLDGREHKRPCGECHLQPGEVCDICGARREHNDMPERANG